MNIIKAVPGFMIATVALVCGCGAEVDSSLGEESSESTVLYPYAGESCPPNVAVGNRVQAQGLYAEHGWQFGDPGQEYECLSLETDVLVPVVYRSDSSYYYDLRGILGASTVIGESLSYTKKFSYYPDNENDPYQGLDRVSFTMPQITISWNQDAATQLPGQPGGWPITRVFATFADGIEKHRKGSFTEIETSKCGTTSYEGALLKFSCQPFNIPAEDVEPIAKDPNSPKSSLQYGPAGSFENTQLLLESVGGGQVASAVIVNTELWSEYKTSNGDVDALLLDFNTSIPTEVIQTLFLPIVIIEP